MRITAPKKHTELTLPNFKLGLKTIYNFKIKLAVRKPYDFLAADRYAQ